MLITIAVIKHRQQHQPPQLALQQNITTVSSLQNTPQTYPPPLAAYPTSAQYPTYTYPQASITQHPYPPASQPPTNYPQTYPPNSSYASNQPSGYPPTNNNQNGGYGGASHYHAGGGHDVAPPGYNDGYGAEQQQQQHQLQQPPPPPPHTTSDTYQSMTSSLASVSVTGTLTNTIVSYFLYCVTELTVVAMYHYIYIYIYKSIYI